MMRRTHAADPWMTATVVLSIASVFASAVLALKHNVEGANYFLAVALYGAIGVLISFVWRWLDRRKQRK